jgi:hypothetical protein
VGQSLHGCNPFVDDGARTSVAVLVCLRTVDGEESGYVVSLPFTMLIPAIHTVHGDVFYSVNVITIGSNRNCTVNSLPANDDRKLRTVFYFPFFCSELLECL